VFAPRVRVRVKVRVKVRVRVRVRVRVSANPLLGFVFSALSSGLIRLLGQSGLSSPPHSFPPIAVDVLVLFALG
jgi:hypothetical protein